MATERTMTAMKESTQSCLWVAAMDLERRSQNDLERRSQSDGNVILEWIMHNGPRNLVNI